MKNRGEIFLEIGPALFVGSAMFLALWFGACEVVHRWESRAPMRYHPEPCQDTTELAGSTTTVKECHKDASGSLETIGGNSFWVCRCARDGGAP